MSRFLAKRLAGAFVVLVLVSLMSFAIIWLVPGDPTAAFLDASATPEQVARLRQELGLDKPIAAADARLVRAHPAAAISDTRFLLNRSVTAAIIERLPVTLSLAGLALVFALVMGVLAGIVAAVNHNRWPDQVVMTPGFVRLVGPGFLARDHADPAVCREARLLSDRWLCALYRRPARLGRQRSSCRP